MNKNHCDHILVPSWPAVLNMIIGNINRLMSILIQNPSLLSPITQFVSKLVQSKALCSSIATISFETKYYMLPNIGTNRMLVIGGQSNCCSRLPLLRSISWMLSILHFETHWLFSHNIKKYRRIFLSLQHQVSIYQSFIFPLLYLPFYPQQSHQFQKNSTQQPNTHQNLHNATPWETASPYFGDLYVSW